MRAACRHGVAAKAQQHLGVALGHQVQRIAQVKAGNGAARAFELVRLALGLAGGKHKVGRCSRSLTREATMPTTPS